MVIGLKTRLFLSFVLLAGTMSPVALRSVRADTETKSDKESQSSNSMGRASSDCKADPGRVLLRISGTKRPLPQSGRASAYSGSRRFFLDKKTQFFLLKASALYLSSLHLREANPSQAP